MNCELRIVNCEFKFSIIRNLKSAIHNKIIALFLLSFVFLISAKAQVGVDLQLADQFFNEGEFEKAADLYEKAYDKNSTDYIYSSYLKCLISMRDFSRAEKLVKKQIKKYPTSQEFSVDLGYVYANAGQTNKSADQFEKVIKELSSDQAAIMNVASRFIFYREFDNAIATYVKGKKIVRANYSFNFELAELYFLKRDMDKMLDEYFEALDANPMQLLMIQNNLQSKFENDAEGKNYEKLKNLLLKKIQKYPDRDVFTELLLWYFIQQKDFESAFIQVKSLDIRNREDGRRMYELAQLCLTNEDYATAEKCFGSIISKGKNYPFYINARIDLLETLNKKITGSPNFTKTDLFNLESEYLKAIGELGRQANTVQMMLGLAHLKTFYLGKPEEGRKILEDAISTPGIQPQMLAQFKLELGDVLLFIGDIWEATLLYSQVEKSFKEDPLGQEAKFRNARLSFYTGEFEWALAQIDVLKSATSQLIANDALSLSLVITDNTAFDTTTDALTLYADADLLMYRNSDSLAMIKLDTLLKNFRDHPLADDAIYMKYKIKRKEKNFEQAATLLQDIISKYSSSILADDAMYNLALLNESVFKNTEKAMELYKELLVKYPASSYVVDARRRFRTLRGDQVN